MTIKVRRKSKKPSNKYKSGFEKAFAQSLEKLGIDFGYEETKLIYTKQHTYYLDFNVKSDKMYIETKGYFKAVDRTKALEVRKAHPELDIRFLFMYNNKIHKLSDTRYGDWCDKHGFKWAVSPKGELPESWLKELLKDKNKKVKNKK